MEKKTMFVVWGENHLLDAEGPCAVAETRELAEEAQRANEWIHDRSEIIEVPVWEGKPVLEAVK